MKRRVVMGLVLALAWPLGAAWAQEEEGVVQVRSMVLHRERMVFAQSAYGTVVAAPAVFPLAAGPAVAVPMVAVAEGAENPTMDPCARRSRHGRCHLVSQVYSSERALSAGTMVLSWESAYTMRSD